MPKIIKIDLWITVKISSVVIYERKKQKTFTEKVNDSLSSYSCLIKLY